MAPFLFFLELPSVCVPSEESLSPCLSISKKKKTHGVEETRRGVMRQSELRPPRRGSRRETVTQIKKKRSHIFIVSSALKIPELDSHRLLSGLKELCKYTSPSISFLLHFVFLPHPSVKAAAPPPSYCSEYLFSISCRLHDRASPSLLLFLLSPGLGGGGRNDKSYLQVTVGNSEIQDVEKFKLFCSFSFFLSFSLSPCFL